ncbi:hypothetical protein [Bartonella sp. HY761]|uniref:hypothetical protein n=1 Tax=Bartonella sp. HY761 TaxID=2979330 RepID=UPI00220C79FC|nr:hypothetical protein [Bartonella sp. HY761]UXN05404.1 hypothetical protein N6A79_08785 [Bartonella sp. HY761]
MADKDKDKDNNDARWTESFGSLRDNPVLRDIKAGKLKPQLNEILNKNKETK